MLRDQIEPLAEVREQPKVEGCEGREVQVVARRRCRRRSAPPIRRDARAEAVVEVAALRLKLVPRSSAGRSDARRR